jgi:uncharacterized lipoprotein YmbA
MYSNKLKLACAFQVALILVLGGCLGGGSQTPPTRYFVLNSLHTAQNKNHPVAELKDAIVVVGPLTLTQVLDRPQIIIRQSNNEIRVSDLDRWAEPLQENLTRVVVDNLAVLLSSGSVIRFPPARTIPVTYQIIIEVTRFDGNPKHEVVLRARWGILGDKGDSVLLEQESVLNEPSNGETTAEMVSAQSRLVAKFSREIAEAIKTLEEQRAGK